MEKKVEKEKTQIPITKEARGKLRKVGHKGETYTEIINKLVKSWKEMKRLK